MKVTFTNSGSIPIIKVSGRIEEKDAEKIAQFIEVLTGNGACQMVLDLSAVAYLHADALGYLCQLIKTTREKGGDIYIVVGDSESVRKHLEYTRLDKIFSIFASRKKAVAKAETAEGKQ